MERHLDNEYRNHYQRFYTASGKWWDSRVTNWREIDWENVIKIEVYIKGNRHVFRITDLPKVLGFLNFRWGGVHKVYDRANLKWEALPIRVWTVGYILPKNRCLLTDIDFHTGKIVKEGYKGKVKTFKAHVHPRLIPKLRSENLIW